MKRLLFVGHEASRSGAPAVELYFLQWLRQNHPDIHIDLILLEGGPLVDDFRSVAEVTVLNGARWRSRKSRVLRKLGYESLYDLSSVDIDNGYDVVIGNTVLSLELLDRYAKAAVPTVCWVHEKDAVIDAFFSRRRFAKLIRKVSRFVSGSDSVKATLISRGVNVPITTVYEPQPNEPMKQRSGWRTQVGIGENAFVVLACASISYRKGTDLFLDAAKQLTERYRDIYFVWVGALHTAGDAFAREFETQRKRAAESDQIVFTGEMDDVSEVFQDADLFVLPSREDPFPLVCLLAADQEKPTVCFAGVGGVPEFVQDDAGSVVEQVDGGSLAMGIERYYLDREMLARHGRRAREKRLGEFSFEKSCQGLFNVISDLDASS